MKTLQHGLSFEVVLEQDLLNNFCHVWLQRKCLRFLRKVSDGTLWLAFFFLSKARMYGTVAQTTDTKSSRKCDASEHHQMVLLSHQNRQKEHCRQNDQITYPCDSVQVQQHRLHVL